MIADPLRTAQRAGRAATDVGPVREADTLVTVAIGLGAEFLVGTRDSTSAAEPVDYHLDRLLNPPD
ncbi:hypothetical protein [Kribbella sp. DT2]|uniref:hypothetical protein n=1 Tax=Kribbella sp. DT2 TaxID=3393427 RepID=UPI003CEB805F